MSFLPAKTHKKPTQICIKNTILSYVATKQRFPFSPRDCSMRVFKLWLHVSWIGNLDSPYEIVSIFATISGRYWQNSFRFLHMILFMESDKHMFENCFLILTILIFCVPNPGKSSLSGLWYAESESKFSPGNRAKNWKYFLG